MDVLADASIAASNHESDAAAILRKLYEHRGGLGQFEEEAADAPLSSPVSEETVDLHATPHPWAQNEDDLLRRLAAARAVATSSGKRMLGDMSTMLSDNSMIWEDIANQLGGRTAAQCASRYQKVLNPENVKGANHVSFIPPRPYLRWYSTHVESPCFHCLQSCRPVVPE